jgi:hypothetical protein
VLKRVGRRRRRSWRRRRRRRRRTRRRKSVKLMDFLNGLNECQCETRLIQNITHPMVSQQIYIKIYKI